jgi:hypothetical protein
MTIVTVKLPVRVVAGCVDEPDVESEVDSDAEAPVPLIGVMVLDEVVSLDPIPKDIIVDSRMTPDSEPPASALV